MTAKELANKLDGIEYPGFAISDEFMEPARASGLFVVYGQSDDIVSFSGAINDEITLFEGTVYVDAADLTVSKSKADSGENGIKILFDCGDGSTWRYETEIPHERFRILETTFLSVNDPDLYCEGLVISVKDLKTG